MSYIIAFKDKSKLQVSDDTAKKLMAGIMEGQIKSFLLGDSLYSVSGVDKIVEKYKAYDIFPDQWESLNTMETIEPKQDFLKLN